MKMLQMIVRPEKEDTVIKTLEEKGIYAITKWDVMGRGQQSGVQIGDLMYDDLPKVMIMTVVKDDKIAVALNAVKEASHTGNYGDGKVFISNVSGAYTVRTGSMAH